MMKPLWVLLKKIHPRLRGLFRNPQGEFIRLYNLRCFIRPLLAIEDSSDKGFRVTFIFSFYFVMIRELQNISQDMTSVLNSDLEVYSQAVIFFALLLS